MITFDYAGDRYELKFNYDTVFHYDADGSTFPGQGRERTQVTLGKVGDDVRYSVTVTRHYKDTCNKELARKFVLAKLFEENLRIFTDKELRVATWKAYLGSRECRKSGGRKVYKEVSHARP